MNLTAITAEHAGYLTGQVVILLALLAGGSLLLAFGIRALLSSLHQTRDWPSPAPGTTDEWLAPPGFQPPRPQRRRGLVRIVVGPVLLLLGLVVLLGMAVDGGAREARSFTDVRLPDQVLGLVRNDQPITDYKAEVRRTVGKGDFDQVDAALYGRYKAGYLVVVNRSLYPQPSASAVAFLADQLKDTGFAVGERLSVPAGHLGGAVRCEATTYPAGFRVMLCVLVTKGSFVAVFDRHDTTLDEAATAALAIQDATVTVR